MIGYWLLAGVMLLLSAFFSGAEIGFLSADKFRIALRERQGKRAGKILGRFLRNPSRFISTLLVGNNIALVLYGTATSQLLDPLWHRLELNPATDAPTILVAETALSTLVVLVLAEYLPKAIFRQRPNVLLARSAALLRFFELLLRPFARVAEGISNGLLRLVLGMRQHTAAYQLTKADLYRTLSAWAEGTPTEQPSAVDAEVFRNAMDLDETRVREFMVPRTEIVGLPETAEVAEALARFRESGYSRLVVYRASLDNVVGYVHVSDLYQRPKQLRDIILPLLAVPETMMASTLLEEFHRAQRSVAVAVDEFGGTAGLVTTEDLVEVVFGEIDDEHDTPETDDEEGWLAEDLGEGRLRLGARWEVADLNAEHGLHLPEDDGDYTTLAGLVMHVAERIPGVGEHVRIGDYLLVVEEAGPTKLEVVRLEPVGDSTTSD